MKRKNIFYGVAVIVLLVLGIIFIKTVLLADIVLHRAESQHFVLGIPGPNNLSSGIGFRFDLSFDEKKINITKLLCDNRELSFNVAPTDSSHKNFLLSAGHYYDFSYAGNNPSFSRDTVCVIKYTKNDKEKSFRVFKINKIEHTPLAR